MGRSELLECMESRERSSRSRTQHPTSTRPRGGQPPIPQPPLPEQANPPTPETSTEQRAFVLSSFWQIATRQWILWRFMWRTQFITMLACWVGAGRRGSVWVGVGRLGRGGKGDAVHGG